MSLELKDFRGKLTVEAYCAIAAHARAHDIDKSEVVRDVMHKWALAQIHSATMLASCLRAKGMAEASEGIGRAASGKSAEPLEWDAE